MYGIRFWGTLNKWNFNFFKPKVLVKNLRLCSLYHFILTLFFLKSPTKFHPMSHYQYLITIQSDQVCNYIWSFGYFIIIILLFHYHNIITIKIDIISAGELLPLLLYYILYSATYLIKRYLVFHSGCIFL